MRIFNTQVYGLRESLIRSGYPMSTEIPDMMEAIAQADWVNVNDRASRLGQSTPGSGHDCFLKGIRVQCDIEAPSYWWPQFQRYHFADIISSQSKMHRITKFDISSQCTEDVHPMAIALAEDHIAKYIRGEITIDQMMANIPMGLQLTAGIDLSYLQIKTMCRQRDAHRLEMWRIFKAWANTLPMARMLGVVV
ncbi:hypothetical protein [Anaeroselena agilis]|uniref:Uncharacterized protein n=1 Tax=Anaeroselena agilis TaxID=3063788 RepID=A0ABU3NYI1_9FIRM|nr:hypothetical protein [Selenomonadales bacterium 4137-cl]